MQHVPPPQANSEFLNVNVGDEITVTAKLLDHWRPARRIPQDDGVPGVIVLRNMKKHRYAIPAARVSNGFILFVPDGLKIGDKLRIKWRDPGCALALLAD